MSFWKSITWQAWKRPIEIPSIYKDTIPAKILWPPSEESPSPASPSFNVATMMSTLLSYIFFEPAKQHWAGGMGEKEATVPMLLSEIVARAAVKLGRIFSVEANSPFEDSQFDGIYLFINWLISWSKTIYIRTSCWSSHWLFYGPVKSARKFHLWLVLSLQGQVNRLWSSFELVGDRRLCTCSESVCHCGM